MYTHNVQYFLIKGNGRANVTIKLTFCLFSPQTLDP
jgi:hypothetical protein